MTTKVKRLTKSISLGINLFTRRGTSSHGLFYDRKAGSSFITPKVEFIFYDLVV